ncbi:MAG: hypothetical protein R2862_07930 [Thermoanaerobaculia bacterium]
MSASFIAFERSLLFIDRRSMKSTTTRPPRSRSRSWRATSRAASRLVSSAISSWLPPFEPRPELTSIAVSASVESMTIEPPEGSDTWRRKICSIWLSRLYLENSGTRST